MPILAIPGEIEIELTHLCNWNCPYCAIHVHQLAPISHEQMIRKIKSISDNAVVTLSGGEPGMLSYKELREVIYILESKHCSINLNTNGLLLKKYKDLIPKFKQIVYHCSQDLELTDQILDVDANNVSYMVIVTDDNVHKLKDFLDAHKDIQAFDIVQATYDKPCGSPTLSKKNRNAILAHFSSRMTKDSIRRMFHEKEWNVMKFI